MINLLIVDDEIFTREGLLEMLPLDNLGITETRQAFDGLDALNIVKDFEPNILLTDVRMPRMNGIELAFEIRKLYPECSIIFMSGYSDKEYLKSAISLKAITYVEKPIELEELEEAIKTAVLENSKSLTIKDSIENKIALEMIHENNKAQLEISLNSLISKELIEELKSSNFVTVLLKTENIIKNNTVIEDLKNICSLYSFNSFASIKDDREIIIQLFFPKDNAYKDIASDIFNSLFISIGEYLSKQTNYYLCVGKIVSTLGNIPTSYQIAKSSLNNSFFYDYNSIMLPTVNSCDSYVLTDGIYSEFDIYLTAEENQKIILYIKQLTSEIRKYTATPVSYIKDIYYRLFLKVLDFASKRNLELDESMNSNYVFEKILQCPNIFVLENFLMDKVNEFFIILKDKTSKSDPVLSVIDYIHNHYSDSNLSLEQISKNTFLTPAYICVIFKDFTSTTVNKYINEYRIEKAKLFLMDSDISMGDIATKVGYSDGNYFSKSFRKATSYTPSEYRRKFSK
ncbi:response regulator [Clostridium sp. C2-6-12]|uniref:response regulator transcription factor n=1 Tax=Clostridium sp. C2-6-12 TaxID=2698832 RepID=UPI001367ABAC|nr:response regulator [Clostridium sp. C2-6-12]